MCNAGDINILRAHVFTPNTAEMFFEAFQISFAIIFPLSNNFPEKGECIIRLLRARNEIVVFFPPSNVVRLLHSCWYSGLFL